MGRKIVFLISIVILISFTCCKTEIGNLETNNQEILDSLLTECSKRLNSHELLDVARVFKQEAVRQNNNKYAGYASGYICKYFHRYYAGEYIDDSLRIYTQQTKEYFEKANEPDLALRTEIDYIRWETLHGTPEQAFIKLFNIIKEAENLTDKRTKLEAYSVLGYAYLVSNSPKEALGAFQSELELIRELKDENLSYILPSYVANFTELANAAFYMNDNALALAYSDSIRFYLGKYPENIDITDLLITSDIISFNTLIEMNKLDEAKPFIERLKSYCNSINEEDNSQVCYDVKSSLANYYLRTKDYNSALNFINEVIGYYTLTSNHDFNYYSAKDLMSEILAARGQFEMAFSLKTEVLAYQDSMAHKNATRQLSEMHTIYQVNELEKQSIEDKTKADQLLLIILFLAVICILLVIIAVIARRNYNKLRKKNEKIFEQYKDLYKYRKEISNLNSSFTNNKDISQKEPTLYEKIEDFLIETQCYKEPEISREYLATQIGTNREYLIRAIQENMNMTFTEYINHHRLEYSQQLLSDIKEIPIDNVYIEAGFNNKSTFYRLFKQKYEMTPKEFQKIAKVSLLDNLA